MPVLTMQTDDAVSDGEVRFALERMAASEAFRGSPQLITFLRYVVEATLRGQADRIKGYTIATEALGRTADFDPQADPIVRVEATRLRRALKRYYADVTGAEGVRIELPLGSYVPAFHRRSATVVLPLTPAAPPAVPSWRTRFAPARLTWRHAAIGAALILLGAGGYAGLAFWLDLGSANQQAMALTSAAPPRMMPAPPPMATFFPVVFVEPFEARDDAAARADADALRAKLRDALARFDDISVMSGAAPHDERTRAAASDPTIPSYYSLSATVEQPGDSRDVSVRLTDIADGEVAFARTFRQARGPDGFSNETIVREVAAALAQPYGVIHARERVQQSAAPAGYAHYRCLLEAYDYWRTYEPAQHARARDCLERSIAAEPSFAAGYTSLAELLLQDYRRNLNVRPGEEPPLERALRAARRAVELKPGSARAYQALMDVYFMKGDTALTLAAGEKAMALNPYNPNIVACYGAKLVSLGEFEKGGRVLKDAVEDIVVRPPWIDFFLFLSAYMTDDRDAAAVYAGQIMSDKFSLGFAARALIAAQRGDADGARRLLDRMVEVYPAWRDDPRQELGRWFPSDAVTGRLARDLAKAGLNATN